MADGGALASEQGLHGLFPERELHNATGQYAYHPTSTTSTGFPGAGAVTVIGTSGESNRPSRVWVVPILLHGHRHWRWIKTSDCELLNIQDGLRDR